MKFAVNYSEEAAAMVRAGTLDIDLFKCPDWQELIEPASKVRPVYVHFPLLLGAGMLAEFDWKRVEHFLATTDTGIVNLHLTGSKAPYLDAVTKPGDQERFIAAAIAEAGPVIARFGADHVMIENVPYYGGQKDMMGWLERPVASDPQTVRTVIDALGCGLLFDLSHARISARHLGVDWRAFIAPLPFDRLHELHLTGLGPANNLLVDHMPMRPEDWEPVEWALGQIKAGIWAQPKRVAVEYGGIRLPAPWSSDAAVMAHDFPRIAALVRNALEPAGPDQRITP